MFKRTCKKSWESSSSDTPSAIVLDDTRATAKEIPATPKRDFPMGSGAVNSAYFLNLFATNNAKATEANSASVEGSGTVCGAESDQAWPATSNVVKARIILGYIVQTPVVE